MLRPGGQFVFLCEEYIASNFISQLNEYFPEEIVGIDSAATKLKGSRKRDEEKRRAKDIIGSSKLTKKSRLFVELELLKASSKTPSTDQSNIKVEQMKARPGLISSVVDVLPWKKVVVGIAVKP